MDSLAPYALPGIIVVSALGALVTCGLALSGRRSAAEHDPSQATRDRRRFVPRRRGYICTAGAFGLIAVLAMVTLTTRAPAVHAPPAASQPPDAAAVAAGLTEVVRQLAADVAQLRGELQRVSDQPSERLSAHGESLGAARSLPRTMSQWRQTNGDATGPRERQTANASPAPPSSRRQAGDARAGDGAGEFSLASTGDHLRATVGSVRVEVRSDRDAAYVVRLLDSSGQPLREARIVLHGFGAQGTTVEVPFELTPAPGIYRGRLPTTEPLGELRLRVVHRDTRFELPLGDQLSQLASSHR